LAIAGNQGQVGNQDVDGLLSGRKWVGLVSVGFPNSIRDFPSDYGPEPTSNFFQASAEIQRVTRIVLDSVEAYTNLRFTYVGPQTADISIAQTSYAETAHARYPGVGAGGDAWFGSTTNFRNPRAGDYAYFTVFHELGHSLGLKHAHEAGGVANVDVPYIHNSVNYTVMSYRSYFGAPVTGGYTNETYGYPTTFMPNDIAALQAMYGVNYSTNAGNTVYSWDPFTGQSFVNGIAGALPGSGSGNAGDPSSNRVFMSIWDGGGEDTFDFSSSTGTATINLRPGEGSILSSAQQAKLREGGTFAANVYTSYLFKGDNRALIENALGGSGADRIIGNAAANKLSGNAGDDNISGGEGIDRLAGGVGVNKLNGGFGNDTAIFNYASSAAFIYQQNGSTYVGSRGSLDSLTSIEVLQFTDKSVILSSIFTPSAASVPKLSLIADNGVTAPQFLAFDQPVAKGSGYVNVYYDDGTLFQKIGWDKLTVNEDAPNQVFLNFNFNPGNYYINIDRGLVINEAGMVSPELSGPSALNFYQGRLDDFAGSSPNFTLPVNAPSTRGYINSNFDEDAFRVNLTAGQIYAFELSTPGVNPADAGFSIQTSTEVITGGKIRYYQATKNETVSVIVRPDVSNLVQQSGAGDYEISVRTVDAAQRAIATNGRLAVGATVSDFLDNPEEVDRFTVDVIAGQTYRFNIDALNRSSLLTLTLYDAAGVNALTSAARGISQIIYNANQTTSLQLEVSKKDSTYTDLYYNLSATRGSFSPPTLTSISPVDTQTLPEQTYSSFTYNGSQITLVFNEAVRAGPGGFIFEAVRTSVRSTFVIEADSNQVAYSGNTVTINLSQQQRDVPGELRLILEQSAVMDLQGSYMTESSVAKFPSGGFGNADYQIYFLTEFYGNPTTTATITVGISEKIVRGFVGGAYWLKTNLKAGTTYEIALLGADYNPSTSAPNTKLAVRSANGDLLAEDNQKSGGANNARLLFTAPVTGTYFIDQSFGAEVLVNVYRPFIGTSQNIFSDFNGDSHSDILFRSQKGALASWELNDTLISGGGNVGNPGSTFAVAALGDFNGDGSSDVLFSARGGLLASWQVSGTTINGGGNIGNPGPAYALVGTGDFNGDGKADLLFLNALTGIYASWQLNGTAITGGGNIGNPGPSFVYKATGDFNGDGHSDILFQNANGTYAIWSLNGTTITGGGNVGNPGAAWFFKGTGDFNGDGKSDLLFQNTDGRYASWNLNGNAVVGRGTIGNPGTTFTLAGIGDYNGDGRSDLLFRNVNGTLATWTLNDTAIIGGGNVGNPGAAFGVASAPEEGGFAALAFQQTDGTVATWLANGNRVVGGGTLGNPGAGWSAKAVADFAGTGEADVLFRHTDGRLATFKSDGSTFIGGGNIGNPGTGWAFKAAADFNGDGRADILFQNISTGAYATWDVAGTAIIGGGNVGTAAGFSFMAAGDLDGDGKDDLLFRNATGNYAAWLLNDTAITGGGNLGNPGAGWTFKGLGDFNGDGKSDMLFQNATGTYASWDMDGTDIVGGGNIGNPGGSFQLAKITDLNSDGKSDLLFRDAGGTYASWLLDDTAIIGGGNLGNLGTDWVLI